MSDMPFHIAPEYKKAGHKELHKHHEALAKHHEAIEQGFYISN